MTIDKQIEELERLASKPFGEYTAESVRQRYNRGHIDLKVKGKYRNEWFSHPALHRLLDALISCRDAVPALIAELKAKDRRIEELEKGLEESSKTNFTLACDGICTECANQHRCYLEDAYREIKTEYAALKEKVGQHDKVFNEIYAHAAASNSQSLPSDDQIIMGHMKSIENLARNPGTQPSANIGEGRRGKHDEWNIER